MTLPSVVRSGVTPNSSCAPPQRDAEAGHHLVEDEHGAVLVADLAQAFEESGHGRDAVHVAGDRLDDDAGDLAADLGEGLAHLLQVVVGQRDGQLGEGRRHAGGARHAECQCARAGLDQERVDMAVVAALELDDLVATRVAAGQTQGAHGRLGAGADHAHHVHARDQLADAVGHDRLQLGRGAEGEALLDALLHGRDDLRMGVAEDHGAPGADVVDIALAVGVDRVGPGGAVEEDRIAADAAKRAHRRVHAAGDMALRGLEEIMGSAHRGSPSTKSEA